MKKLLLVLGLMFTQSSFAYVDAVERFNSLLPHGTYHGDQCTVRVGRTIRGNIKVSVVNPLYRINFVIPKYQFYRYVPGKHFAIYTESKGSLETARNYLFLSYQPEGLNVLVGKSFYSPAESFDRNVDCSISLD